MNRVLRCIQALGTIKCILLTCSIEQGGVRRGGIGREGKRGLVTIFDFPNKGNLRKKALIFLSRLAKVHYNPSKFLRSDDGDGNKSVKKGIGSIREQNTKQTNKQTKSASTAHSFCTFLDATAKLRRDI